ncbi:MAG TPA: serine protease [Oligoflexia bacterium]|nr:serine protease [Oligoflexia bacterium]HMP27062.1 serine protease [Oligoflexia bacterium]
MNQRKTKQTIRAKYNRRPAPHAIKLSSALQWLIGVFLSALCIPLQSVNCQENPINQIIKIEDLKGNCSSGYEIAEKLLITNFHVADNLCPNTDCLEFKATKQNQGRYQTEVKNNFSLLLVIPSLDIAIIGDQKYSATLSEKLKERLSAVTTPTLGQKQTMIGFTGCSEISKATGQALEISPSSLITSARGSFGSSGSPVFNGQGELVAIVSQAKSMFDAAIAKLFGGRFVLKASRLDAARELLLENDPEIRLEKELELLEREYLETLLQTKGTLRIQEGFLFDLKLKKIADSALKGWLHLEKSQPIPKALLLRDPDIIELFNLPRATNRLEEIAFKVRLYNSFENRGFFSKRWTVIDPDQLLAEAQISNQHNLKELRETFELLKNSRWPGLTIFTLSFIAPLILLFLIILVLWGMTLTVIYNNSSGNIAQKIAKTIIIGVCLWPFSVIMLKIYKKRSAKK